MAVLLDINKTQLKVGQRTKRSAVAHMLRVSEQLYLQAEESHSAAFELGLTSDNRMRTIVGDLGRTEWLDRIDELVRAEENEIVERAWLYPRVLWALGQLKSLGLRVGHCSNGNPYGQVIAQRLGLLDPKVADAAAFSFEIGSRKPDPELYLESLRRIGTRPENTLFVGDGSDNELAGAHRLGMSTILVRNPGEKAKNVHSDHKIGPIAALPRLIKPLLATS